MIEKYRSGKIPWRPTAEDVRELFRKVDQGMREKYGSHLERMPERPGLTGEARKWSFKSAY